jgi:cytochrome c oxidase subunit 4
MPIILTVLSLMSAIKFFAVILWFMHLIYDHKLLFWIFMCGLVLAFATYAALLSLFSVQDIDTKWFS